MEREEVFRERLRDTRGLIGVSQKRVADRLGITSVAYQNYEVGRRRPTFEVIPQLATFFRVSSDYLLGLTDEPTPPSAEEWAMIHAYRKAKAEAAAKQETKTDDEK